MEHIERILVMGAGPGGIACAASLAQRGFAVALFNRSPGRLAPLQERGGVEIEGVLGDSFVSIPVITTDIEGAIDGAQCILVAVPGYGQIWMVRQCLPYFRPGHLLVLLCGSTGSLEAAQWLLEAGYSLDDVLLGETVTLPVSARMVGDARVRIKLPSTLRAAAFPGRNTERLVDRLGQTLQLISKRNVLDPGLNNPNFLIHPAPMLLNYAAVERAGGFLSIMNEGMTDGVLRLMDAVDAEKMAIQERLGLDVISVDDLYRELGSSPDVYRQKGEPFGLRDRIWDRYIEEDVPFGTVLFSSLGDLIGVPTPICDGINHILSAVEGVDFWSIGRTAEKLGLAGLDLGALNTFLETGQRP